MDTVTYPNTAVIDYINKNFIPIQVNIKTSVDLLTKYRVFWTPAILILDSRGTEYYRIEGFLPSDEFIPQLKFGLGRMALEKGDYKKASSELKVVIDTYPKSDAAPAAQYWLGVSDYKATHNTDALLSAWREIMKDYPNSIWAHKVSFAF